MITTDKKAIFLKRADWLAENPGMIDVPGGHAEPENLKNDFDDEQKIIKEIFDSQKQEIMEETNTDVSLITSHKMHGLFGLPPSKRPVTYFITYVEKSAKEILTAFNKTDEKYGQTAQEESSYLFEVDLQNLKDFWLKGENMCGNGQFAAGVYLYSVGEISREEFFEVVNRSVAFANKFESK